MTSRSLLIISKIVLVMAAVALLWGAATLLFPPSAKAYWEDQLLDRFQTWETVKEIKVKFLGEGGGFIATFFMRDGSCTQFKANNEDITQARECGEDKWIWYFDYIHED